MDREHERLRDADLVLAGLNGNRQALQQLVEFYYKPVFNITYRVLNDQEAAADATQTTFLHVFEKLGSFDPRYKFFSWIYRIALNEALDQSKKMQRFTPQDPEEVVQPTEVGPEAKADDVETIAVIQNAVAGLQEDYRTVIILRHFSELSYDEIAHVLDIPVKTVRSRLYSARQLLKTGVAHTGIFPHD